MSETDQREALARLARDRGVGYAALSRLLGRNAAYIQQFIKRGSPRKLEEADRGTLAKFFGVAESALGGPAGGQVIAFGHGDERPQATRRHRQVKLCGFAVLDRRAIADG